MMVSLKIFSLHSSVSPPVNNRICSQSPNHDLNAGHLLPPNRAQAFACDDRPLHPPCAWACLSFTALWEQPPPVLESPCPLHHCSISPGWSWELCAIVICACEHAYSSSSAATWPALQRTSSYLGVEELSTQARCSCCVSGARPALRPRQGTGAPGACAGQCGQRVCSQSVCFFLSK